MVESKRCFQYDSLVSRKHISLLRRDAQYVNSRRCKELLKKPTIELVRLIVEKSDKDALKVLLDTRRLFLLKGEPPLLLPEFLMKLRDRLNPPANPALTRDTFADCVYDLTRSKYSNFPDSPKQTNNRDDFSQKRVKVDCRKYYRAFYDKMMLRIDQGTVKSQAEEESLAGKTLKNLVYRNFYRSKLECERYSPFYVRYTWKIEGVKLYLWYPRYMKVKKFKAWLKENVSDVNPTAENEQKRIQSLINATFSTGGYVSLDEPTVQRTSGKEDEASSVEFYEGFGFVGSLADTVAQEKIKNIDELRPGIKKLGKRNIERLILQIFSKLSAGEYEAARLAEQYGISKATFSRFAGSKWVEKIGDTDVVIIPDLWRNTAKILAGDPAFMETVLTSGFACKLEELLAYIKNQEGKKNDR